MDARQIRRKEIATTKKIRYDEERHIYLVPSQSSDKVYFVDEKLECNCPDALTHKAPHASIPTPSGTIYKSKRVIPQMQKSQRYP